MMTIHCMLGKISNDLPVPEHAAQLCGTSFKKYFSDGSRGNIQLVIDDSPLLNPLFPALREVDSLDLHQAVQKLAKNPTQASKVDRIALVFAGKYKPKPTALGIMFDWGRPLAFDDRDTTPFQGVPREGCAVFLDCIRELRGDGESFRNQLGFTMIHELGHVFNLQHRESPLSFMSTSKIGRSYDQNDGAFLFAEQDQGLLEQCPTSHFIWPGGSEFGSLGPLSSADVPYISHKNKKVDLQLSVDIHPREFWAFEPVELELSLRVCCDSKKTFRVPDTVDPGYEQFCVWIEEPTGERRRFRSPRRYCWNGKRLTVSPELPFHRDISLFIESTGYAFRRAGRHQIYATFQISKSTHLKSNIVEVNVLQSRPNNSEYCSMRGILTRREHAKVLYYRRASRSRRELASMIEYTNRFSGTPTSAAVSYAVGRALKGAAGVAKSATQMTLLARQAVEHLTLALQSEALSRHRQHIAEYLLKNDLDKY